VVLHSSFHSLFSRNCIGGGVLAVIADCWVDNGNIYIQPYAGERYNVDDIVRPLRFSYLPASNLYHSPVTHARAKTLYEVASPFFRYHESFTPFLTPIDSTAKTALDLPEPPSKTSSWLHQRQAFHFLKNLPAGGLFADMGTGKTKVVVDLINENHFKRTLIVCPKRVMYHWPREFKKHSINNIRVVVLDGPLTMRAAVLRNWRNADPVVFVTNYDGFQYEKFSDVVFTTPFDACFLDESHKIKAAGGKTSMFFAKFGRRVARRFCLTGTPNADKPLDVYAQYRFLDPGIFGTRYDVFKRKYAIFGGYQGREIITYSDLDDLHERMYTIAFRVTADVLDLPELQEIDIPVKLSDRAALIYLEMYKKMVVHFESGTATVNNTLARLTRLAQISSGYLPVEDAEENTHLEFFDTTKQETLEELISDIPDAEPVVVFARFHQDLERIKEVCGRINRPYMELSGRKDQWEEWQYRRNSNEVLAVQISAGGAGVELFRSHYGIYYSFDYSLTNWEQSHKRLHRPGQTKDVRLYVLAAGLDPYILDALREKKSVAEYVADKIGKDPSAEVFNL
jgi:SNF2 family DNA or RNA helicase